MFEQSLENHMPNFFVDQEEARICSEYGIPLHAGFQLVAYTEAVTIVIQGDALFVNVPNYLQKRFKALFNGLRNAFGPEFWRKHPDRMGIL